MAVAYHVLASGSTGNAAWLDVDGFGILVDFGVPQRELTSRLRQCRLSWERLGAAVLTHPHSDHWNEAILARLRDWHIPLLCDTGHANVLAKTSAAMGTLMTRGLVHAVEARHPVAICPTATLRVIPLPHDDIVTLGLRFDGPTTMFGPAWRLTHLTDLGSWTPELADFAQDSDVLALEFNHDVTLQLQSGRPLHLVRRILGDGGHLSNRQAADLLAEIVRRSEPDRLRSLVQLHLSEDCNTRELALQEASNVLVENGVAISVAEPDRAGPSVDLTTSRHVTRRARRARAAPPRISSSQL